MNLLSSSTGDEPAVAAGYMPTRYARLLSVDAIRGIALMGILLISVWEFGGFSTNQQAGLQLQQKGADYYLYALTSILFEGKMRGLFSLVFGVSIMLYMTRQKQESLAAAQELYVRRQLWLIVFGVINAMVLLWPGDILFHLGITGLFLFPFFRMSKKELLICALIATIFYCGKIYWDYADDKKALSKYQGIQRIEERFKKDSADRHHKDSLAGLLPDSIKVRDSVGKKNDTLTTLQQWEKSSWEGISKREKYDSANTVDKMERKAMRKGYGEIWDHLVERSKKEEARWLYRTGIWDIGSLMLLGMTLFGYGFFSSSYAKNRYLLFGLLSIAAGVALAWLRLELLHVKVPDYEKYINKYSIPPNQFFPLERLLLSFGYLSFFLWLIRCNILKRLWSIFGPVGRMAFTNYLMQTIICVLFFYGFGAGYFGRLSFFQLYFFVLEIWLIQIVFSVLWLRLYAYGPAEWLWRSLTSGRWLPNKITQEKKENTIISEKHQ